MNLPALVAPASWRSMSFRILRRSSEAGTPFLKWMVNDGARPFLMLFRWKVLTSLSSSM